MLFFWYVSFAIVAFYLFRYGRQILHIMSTKYRDMTFRVCTKDEFPNHIEDAFSETVKMLEILGFVNYQLQYQTGPINLEHWVYVLLKHDAKAYAVVELGGPLSVPGWIVTVTFDSYLQNKDKSFELVFTTNNPFNRPMGELPNATWTNPAVQNIEDLWAHHQETVSEQVRQKQAEPIILLNLVQFSTDYFRRYFERLVANNDLRHLDKEGEYRISFFGALRQMRETSQVRKDAQKRAVDKRQQMAPTKMEQLVSPEVEAAIFCNLKRVERNVLPLISRVFVFLFTFILSFIAFSLVFDVNSAVNVILVLFVHEFGHYLAMRLTGYQNLSVFFVPLFGAAVQGQKTNATLAEKVFVLLAGPLPGILLGFAFLHFVVGTFAPWGIEPPFVVTPSMLSIVIFAYILNFLNLLPLFPLDGGQIVNLAFFAMPPWIDRVLKITALVAFALGAWWLQDPVMLMLAVFVGWLIFRNFNQAAVLYDLRRHLPESVESPIGREVEIFEGLNKVRLEDKPYQHRASFVKTVVENWPTFNSTIWDRFWIMFAYITSLSLSLYIIYLSYHLANG